MNGLVTLSCVLAITNVCQRPEHAIVMATYLFVESRDPFTSVDAQKWADYVGRLSELGDDVSVMYVNDGVMTVRARAHTNVPFMLLARGVRLFVDGWSLQEHGVPAEMVVDGVAIVDVDHIVDHLARGSHVVWH